MIFLFVGESPPDKKVLRLNQNIHFFRLSYEAQFVSSAYFAPSAVNLDGFDFIFCFREVALFGLIGLLYYSKK